MDPGLSIVSVLGRQMGPVGVGFVVGDRQLLTCAHVVNAALGRDERTASRPKDEVIYLGFPTHSGRPLRQARVDVWHPPPQATATPVDGPSDVAGLVLVGEGLPGGAEVATLSTGRSADHQVKLFGYPSDRARPHGGWATGRLVGRVGGGYVQLDADTSGALRAQAGFSGSPVIDESSGHVVGMFAVASRLEQHRDCYAVPPELLRAAWPDLLDKPPCPYRGLAVNDQVIPPGLGSSNSPRSGPWWAV